MFKKLSRKVRKRREYEGNWRGRRFYVFLCLDYFKCFDF